MRRSVRVWLHGLGATAIAGSANGVITGLAAIGIDPDHFNMQGGLGNTFLLAGASALLAGFVAAAYYLKQSPLPPLEGKPPSATKRLLVVLLLCSASAWGAQRAVVWTATVTAVDEQNNAVYIEFFKDGLSHVPPVAYPIPANGMTGVRVIVRDEIKRLDAKDQRPAIVKGPVLPAADDPAPPPPPAPTQDELDRAAFGEKVQRLERLRRVLPASDTDLRALEAEVAADIKLHPEWEKEL